MTKDTLQNRPSNKKLLVFGLLLLVLLTASVLSFLKARNTVVPPSSNTKTTGLDTQHTNVNSAEHTINPKNVSRLVPYWIDQLIAAEYPEAIVNGVVYMASQYTPIVEAVDARTGKQLWLTRLGGNGGCLAVANGIVYAGCTADGDLYAFKAERGAFLWRKAGFGGPPVVANGIIYTTNSSGNLCALDAKSGAELWVTTNHIGTTSGLAHADGIVYQGIDDALYAFDAKTGKFLWSSATGDNSYLASAGVANGIVYAKLLDKLYAFDAKTGKILWVYQAKNDLPTAYVYWGAVADGIVYFIAGSGNFYLYALDAKTGMRLWVYVCPPDADVSVPFVANGVLYISADQLHAFNPKTGSPLWSYSGMPGDSFHSQPIVIDGVVYVEAAHGPGNSYDYRPFKLYALHLPNTTQ